MPLLTGAREVRFEIVDGAWWHLAHGDRSWGLSTGHPTAVFNSVEQTAST